MTRASPPDVGRAFQAAVEMLRPPRLATESKGNYEQKAHCERHMTPEKARSESKRMAIENLPELAMELIAHQQGAPLDKLFVLPELVSICAVFSGDEKPLHAAANVVTQASLAHVAGAKPSSYAQTFEQMAFGLSKAARIVTSTQV